MQKVHVQVLNPTTGGARPGALVTVYVAGTTNLATLYADDEVTPITNPRTADSAGRVSFKAENGEYDLHVSGSGFTSYTYDRVQVFDKDTVQSLIVHDHSSTQQGGQLNAGTVFAAGVVLAKFLPPISRFARLSRVSATQLRIHSGYLPLKVGGEWKWHYLDSSGITLSNAGLSANTLYYIYVYDDNGAVTAVALTTGHAIDPASGVETLSSDSSRTLVGMVRTDSSVQFPASATNRQLLRSYLQRDSPTVHVTGAGTTSSGSFVAVQASEIVETLTWDDEVWDLSLNGWSSITVKGGPVEVGLGIDSTSAVTGQIISYHGADISYNTAVVASDVAGPSEGYHFAIALHRAVSSGSVSTRCRVTGRVRRVS